MKIQTSTYLPIYDITRYEQNMGQFVFYWFRQTLVCLEMLYQCMQTGKRASLYKVKKLFLLVQDIRS